MDALLRKLQYKAGDVVVVDAPAEMAPTLEAWRREVPLRSDLRSDEAFVLRFVHSCAQIDAAASPTVAAVADDGLLWFAYPKKSSRRYSSDIGRDDSWHALGSLGFEGVRQVAIDEDWSALRFRHVDRIRSLTRDKSRAISERGKSRPRSS
jgi:hypothetical protein